MSDMLRTMGTAMGPDAATRAGVPGGIVEFPENVPPAGSKPFDEGMRSPWDVGGWHPPMALPSSPSPEQPAGSSDQGGFFGTVGKIASNPLLLAALRGYAGALGMPRGAGPITRIAGGLSSGLEDYFVGMPYRQTQMEKAKAETEKEKAQTDAAKQKAKSLGSLSPEEQKAANFPGLARIEVEKTKMQGKSAAAQSLVPQYRAQAAALEKSNPPMAQVYSQAADALQAGAEPKDVAGMVRLGQQGEHNGAMEGLRKQSIAIEQQNAATSAAHLGIAEQGLSLQRQKEGRESEQAKKTQEQADTRIDMAKQRDVRAADKSAVDTAHKQYADQPFYKRMFTGKSEQDFENEARQRQGAVPQPHVAPQPGSGQPIFTIKMLPDGRAQFPDGVARSKVEALQFFQQHGIDPTTVHQE